MIVSRVKQAWTLTPQVQPCEVPPGFDAGVEMGLHAEAPSVEWNPECMRYRGADRHMQLMTPCYCTETWCSYSLNVNISVACCFHAFQVLFVNMFFFFSPCDQSNKLWGRVSSIHGAQITSGFFWLLWLEAQNLEFNSETSGLVEGLPSCGVRNTNLLHNQLAIRSLEARSFVCLFHFSV